MQVFAFTPALPPTYGLNATSVTAMLKTLPLKATDVAFKTPALTNVPQGALNVTVKSDIACHALGIVYDPGINTCMEHLFSPTTNSQPIFSPASGPSS